MSNEIQLYRPELVGKTLYATLRDRAGDFRNTSTSAWDATSTAGEFASYTIAMNEVSTLGWFRGSLPSGVSEVDADHAPYHVTVHQRLGGSPAASDPIVGTGSVGPAAADVRAWKGNGPQDAVNGSVPAWLYYCADDVITPNAIADAALTGGSLAESALDAIAAGILQQPAQKLATDSMGRVTVGSNADKTGYALAANGLDSITIDGQTLVQAFQIVLAALSGNISSGGSGASGQYIVNLTTARNNLAARLAEVTASPKPSYSVGGQSVSWAEYQRLLLDQLAVIDERINGAEPFESQSQIFS